LHHLAPPTIRASSVRRSRLFRVGRDTRSVRALAGDRLRTLGIVVSALTVWVGMFAVVVASYDGDHPPLPTPPTVAAAAPSYSYDAMLRDVAARTADEPVGSAATPRNNRGQAKKRTSAAKAQASRRTEKASTRTHAGIPTISGPPPADAGALPPLDLNIAGTTPPTTGTTPPTSGTTPPTTGTTPPTTGGDPQSTEPILSLDDPRLTAEQRAAAQDLIDRTTLAMSLFPTAESVMAAGYEWIGDEDANGFRHYINWSYLADGRELDEAHIESIVLQRDAFGELEVVSALYILEPGKTMADVPDIAGALTSWRYRDDVCWNGHALAGVFVDGACTPGGERMDMPPMLYVWLVPNECGPFAAAAEGSACEQ
jgi:hypothetical protein